MPNFGYYIKWIKNDTFFMDIVQKRS